MSLFHESIKQILSEIEKFLVETLKKENKLSKKTQEHKQQILNKLNTFYEENPSMKIVPCKETPKVKEGDETSLTGSTRSDESEDVNYIDAGVVAIAAADLKDAVFSGHIEKKQKKAAGLFGGIKFHSRWCVIQNGVFYYYAKPEDKKPHGAFKLEGYKFKHVPDLNTKKKEMCFELHHDDETKRAYQFVAKRQEDFEKLEMYVGSGGQPLIEEDVYEEVGEGKQSKVSQSGEKDKKVSDDDSFDYKEPDEEPVGKPLPSRPPIPKSKFEVKVPNSEPVASLIEEDIYDEAMSALPVRAEPVPPMLLKSPKPAIPEIPWPVVKRICRDLPEVPPISPLPRLNTHPKTKINICLTHKPEEDFENMFYGKWDCMGDNFNELSFKKGDIIHIISKQFDGKLWWVGELNGRFGFVPSTYMTQAYKVAA